jgi:adenylosuccinate synthase
MKRYFNSYAVIGLGFGDEGKGLTVNSLCRQLVKKTLVIRFSGGQQAGHTVTLPDGRSHVFSNFGSGTFQGSHTYWSRFCTLDPVGLIKERDILAEKGTFPGLYIDARSPVTTPYDKLYNQTVSSALQHGTCGAGVGATLQREEKFYSLLAGDLLYPSVVRIKLALIKSYYGTEVDTKHFLECCEIVRREFNIVTSVPRYENYVFEGSQGLLLDQNIGFFPHVTRSNTGTKNILELVNENEDIGYPEVLLVTRAFQTRHGNGPMTNATIPNNIAENTKETNVSNKYQGEFKRALLDVDLLKYAIDKDPYIKDSVVLSPPSVRLVITCMDLVRNEHRYTLGGEIVGHTNATDFAIGIGAALGIGPVHMTYSPDAIVDLNEEVKTAAAWKDTYKV